MHDDSSNTYAVPSRVSEGSPNPINSFDGYLRARHVSTQNPDGYWLDETRRRLVWRKEPTRGLDGSFHDIANGPISWFGDGMLNITETCLDQHAAKQPNKTAIIWEGDSPDDVEHISYAQLSARVNQAANGLRELGVLPGDRVILYMGMVPQAAIAMLACARVGAVHSVVFGGFSAEALRDRVEDCDAKVVITQDEGLRGGRKIPLKATTDEALEGVHHVKHVVVMRRTKADVPWVQGRDHDWVQLMSRQNTVAEPAIVSAEHPLFILYTSGSTGRPKGLVHTCGGYLTWTSYTHQTVFDLRPDDIYACVADVGWITGHSYIVYGPLANGATTLMFESTPLFPDPGRYWDMVARHKITQFYTAPTAIRALAAKGDEYVHAHDRSTLRVLGSVGEPINPDAWKWYFNVVGEGRCTIVDTWWQTETGGICISPVAPATPTKPGSATLPMPGIHPILVDDEGRRISGPAEGRLCITDPWPGMARTVYGDHERYHATYFALYQPYYFTGDGCRRDEDGYHWITGRVDDVLNVSGHRMGTAEFESALVSVDAVAEAAVVGYPHPIKGQGVHAYIVLQAGAEGGESAVAEMQAALREHIGALARVDRFQFIPGLPKTRSGKVMRRILRKIAEGRGDQLGDVSTLADPSVVEKIKASVPES